jgi:DNA-binding CsgD family transcriptional regulator/GAF domain-containing protein
VAHSVRTLSQERVLGLIGRIYDAAADELLWTGFLEDFGEAVDGAATSLVYHDMAARRAAHSVSVRTDPVCERLYLTHYGSVDLLREVWLKRFSRAGPEAVVTSEQVIEPLQFKKTEYYNDFLRPNNIDHSFCGPITLGAHWSSVLTCLRPRKKGPFGEDAVALLRALLPHLQRAIQFRRKLSELEGRERASLDALDRLNLGVALLDQAGRILAANFEANQAFRDDDGLQAGRDGIAADLPSENLALGSLIANAIKTATGHGTGAGGSLAISRPSGKRSYALLVAPIARGAFCEDAGKPAAIVFITDPECKPEAAAGALARIYGLTAAESRLAELLMEGETVVNAAGRLRVSHNTARTHLKRVFEKTWTRHQGELVRLLVGSAAALKQK